MANITIKFVRAESVYKKFILSLMITSCTYNTIRYLLSLLVIVMSYDLYSMVSPEEYSVYGQEYINSEVVAIKNLVTESLIVPLISLKKEDQDIIIQPNASNINQQNNSCIVNKTQKYYSELNICEDVISKDFSIKDECISEINGKTTNIKEVCLIEIGTQETNTSEEFSKLIAIKENNIQEDSSVICNIKTDKIESGFHETTIENQDNNSNPTNILNKYYSIEYTALQINKINSYKQIYPEIGFLLSNEGQLTKAFKENIIEEMILFILLNGEISNKNINEINKKYQLIKFFACVLAVFNGIGIFAIGNNNNVSADIVLSTQYLTPVYVNTMYYMINSALHKSKKGYSNIVKHMLENKIKSFEVFIRVCLSIYLAYLASVIEIRLSGDGYTWMFSHFLNNKNHLNIAYNIGYFNKLILYIVLNGSLYYILLGELIYKTGIGYLLRLYPPPTKSIEIFTREKHINRLLYIINTDDRDGSSKILSNYLKDYRINDAVNIAGMQNIIINNYQNKKKYNLCLNISSLLLIGVISAFCGLSFKQVFSSKIILKDFIFIAGTKVNETLKFTLKNNEIIICKNIEDCIRKIDFANIYISKEAYKDILKLEKEATIANSLTSVALSSCAVITVIKLVQFIVKIPKDNLLKNAIKSIHFRKENIIPYLFCCSIFPSLYFYNIHLASAQSIVEKNNLLLKNMGEETILNASQAIIISILCINIMASKYLVILADIPRYIRYLASSNLFNRK